MHSEDPDQRLKRQLEERRRELTDQIARGSVNMIEGPSGYWAMTGRVRELDDVLRLIDECLFGKRTPEPDETRPFDPYGVR